MKKIIAIALAVALTVVLTASFVSAAQPVEKPWKTTPKELPVLKLPGEYLPGKGGPPADKGKPDNNKEEPVPPDTDANKLAVVIGIAEYRGNEDLWNSDEDAQEMATALIDVYGFPEENVKVLLNRDAKAKAIISAIEWLAEWDDADDSVVFFFSGHGFTKDDSAGWDGDEEVDGVDEGIVTHDMYGLTDGFLKDKFSELETEKLTLVFAQCHSGGMFDDDDDLQNLGRVIPAACKAEQYAWDFLYYGNTLFGYYFIDQGILEGLADPDGEVSMEEALAYAHPLVLAESLAIQNEFPDIDTRSEPQIYDGFTGDLIP